MKGDMSWKVEFSEIKDWLDGQDVRTLAGIEDAVSMLEREGPNLGRPLVDTIHGSRIRNMKELRPSSPGGGEIRILFVFDPHRRAIFLVAGDKARAKRKRDAWNGWYRKAIPLAERRYERYLERQRGEHGLS